MGFRSCKIRLECILRSHGDSSSQISSCGVVTSNGLVPATTAMDVDNYGLALAQLTRIAAEFERICLSGATFVRPSISITVRVTSV